MRTPTILTVLLDDDGATLFCDELPGPAVPISVAGVGSFERCETVTLPEGTVEWRYRSVTAHDEASPSWLESAAVPVPACG